MFVVRKNENTLPWPYVISHLNGEEIYVTWNVLCDNGMFYVTEMQKANQKQFRAEKLIKSKGGKLYVKRKGYDHSFNSWVDKKGVAIQNDLFPEPYKKINV